MSERPSVETDADAVWQFALDFARTSGDSPECQCVSCRACRAIQCPGCGDSIPARYRDKGVCGNCYGTTDDPFMPRVIPPVCTCDLPENYSGAHDCPIPPESSAR